MFIGKLFKEVDGKATVYYFLTKRAGYSTEGFVFIDSHKKLGETENKWVFLTDLSDEWETTDHLSQVSLSEAPNKQELIMTIFEIEF